jgi:4-amino-4-deoxy-L-arabinose transferase-like glycosyltransferase
MKKIIFLILILGVIFRIFLTVGGNFYFNMDNARDMIDVREMVIFGEPRLIGPTTSIDGVYFGPLWYYMLSIPFLLTGGDPYGSIVMEIILWAFGGYFLFTLVNKYYGKLALLSVSLIWTASNFILLGSQYAFNPNPVLFLTPVFIYSLLRYIETGKSKFSMLTWFLAGSFFHFIVPVGIFMPVVIILTIFLIDKKLLKQKSLFFGLAAFILTFVPQLIFELRHNFFMFKNLFDYNSTSHGNLNQSIYLRVVSILKSFYDTLLPTFMNFKFFTITSILLLFGILTVSFHSKRRLDNLTLVSLLLIFVPLIGLIPLKVDIMRWYLNAEMVVAIILVGFVINSLQKIPKGYVIAFSLVAALTIFSLQNISEYLNDARKGSINNSILANEIVAIDFVYQKAENKNFKVYTYIPSVYDYPYQYLFWWYGLKKYGYLPEEYAYLPKKPEYVAGKDKINGGNHPESSEFIFLIKESDQIGQRHLWENTFKDLELLETHKVGPLDIEIRRESPSTSN